MSYLDALTVWASRLPVPMMIRINVNMPKHSKEAPSYHVAVKPFYHRQTSLRVHTGPNLEKVCEELLVKSIRTWNEMKQHYEKRWQPPKSARYTKADFYRETMEYNHTSDDF